MITDNNLIGRQFPFFLSNVNLTDAFYLYQIYSPGVDEEDFNPYISLTKVVEKSKINQESRGNDSDLLASMVYPKRIENYTEYVSDLLKKEAVDVTDGSKQENFPNLKPLTGNNPQKSLIISLRNNLRWKNYRLFPGRVVDILWTPTKFVVCKIVDNEKYVWLEPIGVYKNTDLTLSNPLDVDLSTLNINVKLEKGPKLINDLMYSIRGIEWSSFDRADK